MTQFPKYYLADVPHDLRTRVLDLCIRRLWHDALEVLQQHRFNHDDRGDLISFYDWAPARLPSQEPADPPLKAEENEHPHPGPLPNKEEPPPLPPPAPESLPSQLDEARQHLLQL